MKRSYDMVAPVYDGLAKLFIGSSLHRAQTGFLPLIPPHAKILIAGGGTGWILEEITKVHPQGLCIDYVDISAKMIALSKQRNCGSNEVHFFQKSILDHQPAQVYDVVITPFFLDNFKEETVEKIVVLIGQNLKENGLWIYTDFQVKNKNSLWQKTVLFIMYSFFRLVCGIEGSRLSNVIAMFQTHRYQLLKNQTFLHGFITTSVYKKLIPYG